MTENPAVLRYVARKYPAAGLWPEDAREDARCLEWLGWCTSGVHVAYAHMRRPERYATSDAAKADVVARGRETARDGYSVADPYLFTFWTWGRGKALGYDMARDFPRWTEHARRMGERGAVRRALAREGIAAP